MANLTIAVDEKLLRQARIRALEQGLSINALLREYLENFAGSRSRHRRAVEAIHEIAQSSRTGSGGKKWTRDELYEPRLNERS